MISPTQIKIKALKIWETHFLLQNYLTETNSFPINLALPKYTAKILQQDFAKLRTWIKELVQHSKDEVGFGYQLIFKTINHRQLGEQQLPTHIAFTSSDDFLAFIGKKNDYQQFCKCAHIILTEHPILKSWLCEHTAQVLIYQDKWQSLLNVCHFFLHNSTQGRYLRELNIPGIDTKFIEQHKKIISDLLEKLLPSDRINHKIIQRGSYYFEQRYYLKHDEQLIRFRTLDFTLIPSLSAHDISLPLSEFRKINIPCKRVFITENKINGLSFPMLNQAIVIFGLGYGIQSLSDICWLQNKEIIYWGDIDTHGFAMLSQLRSYYPQTQSFLMNQTTLEQFKCLWVQECSDKRCTAFLNHLDSSEQELYKNLSKNIWGDNIRLEQERINFNFFCDQLSTLE